jgi:calmodulin
VTAKELRIVFDTLGQQPSDEDLAQMIAEVDKDGNGEMEFTELCVLMSKRMCAPSRHLVHPTVLSQRA